MEKNIEQGRGVRKGAWTKEEDNLLRKCVEKYGEGKWHLVPVRVGLNRCRKSCRLRWLNYLRPNLKRGIFDQDEVDLIVRLHKLLGNRWSWIAGRIPGRTANDIKNFWNTHFEKKSPPAAATGEGSRKAAAVKTITESNIIRPQPRNFSNNCPSDIMTKTNETNDAFNEKHTNNNNINNNPSDSLLLREAGQINYQIDLEEINEPLIVSSEDQGKDQVDECIRWWGDLLEMTEKDEASAHQLLFSIQPIAETTLLSPIQRDHDNNCANRDCFGSGFCLDVDLWELLNSDDL